MKKGNNVSKTVSEFGVSQLVSILLDGLESTRDVVAVLERDSALDGRTRQELQEHVVKLAKLVVDAEVFRAMLQVRLNNLASGSAQVQQMLSNDLRRVRDEG